MDERERDRFYSSAPDEPDDDLEYEVEPPDAEVLAAEERRAQEAIEATRTAIDIDEIYRDVDRDRGSEILESWTRDFRFRFQVKHLLVMTAVLAIALTLHYHGLLGTALVLLVMFSVAGLYLYLLWQEQKHREEADRRRDEIYARRRQKTAAMGGTPVDSAASSPPAATTALPAVDDSPRKEAAEGFRFQFSLLQLMTAMVVAAVVLGMVRVLGGPASTATLLGMVALIGLVVHAVGFEPPHILVLGWWLILIMYVLLSFIAVMWQGFV